MDEPSIEDLGNLAQTFNNAVLDLFLLNFNARNAFEYALEADQAEKLRIATLRQNPVPAVDYLTEANIYAKVLTDAGQMPALRSHDLQNFIPPAAKTEDVRKALEKHAPAFAALCR